MIKKLRIRTLDIQRGIQAHELEEKKYELQERNHQLEQRKIIVDILKHFTTIITGLLLLLTYIGDKFIPMVKITYIIPFIRISSWTVIIMGMSLSLGFSLIALAFSAVLQDDKIWNFISVLFLLLIMGMLGVVTTVFILGILQI